MRRLLVLIAILLFTAPQAADACVMCYQKSTSSVTQSLGSENSMAAVSEASIHGLILNAASPSNHAPDSCPCCPPDTDCSDCIKCIGLGAAIALPESADGTHLPATNTIIESSGAPCSRTIARPGRPPQSNLR
tara:strand:+ start:319 stop:717 length:399 start_codon:yes stop_codon:yes gene_type:complete